MFVIGKTIRGENTENDNPLWSGKAFLVSDWNVFGDFIVAIVCFPLVFWQVLNFIIGKFGLNSCLQLLFLVISTKIFWVGCCCCCCCCFAFWGCVGFGSSVHKVSHKFSGLHRGKTCHCHSWSLRWWPHYPRAKLSSHSPPRENQHIPLTQGCSLRSPPKNHVPTSPQSPIAKSPSTTFLFKRGLWNIARTQNMTLFKGLLFHQKFTS